MRFAKLLLNPWYINFRSQSLMLITWTWRSPYRFCYWYFCDIAGVLVDDNFFSSLSIVDKERSRSANLTQAYKPANQHAGNRSLETTSSNIPRKGQAVVTTTSSFKIFKFCKKKKGIRLPKCPSRHQRMSNPHPGLHAEHKLRQIYKPFIFGPLIYWSFSNTWDTFQSC